jgi:DNA-nicking Smr family endonuclease
MRRRRILSTEEKRLWAHVAREFVPLPGRPTDPIPVADLPKSSEPAAAPPPKTPAPVRAPAAAKPAIPPLAPMERKTRSRLRRGATSVDDVLDLHGLRQADAHARLVGFLHRSQSRGHAIVLVITGKGGAAAGGGSSFDERGVLKRSVPHWLRLPDLRPLILGFEDALPHHGGEGALYVRLRRRRTSV